MPLILRALPLSLMTLWHYVFVLPLVVIASVPFLLLTLVPVVGVLVVLGIITFITFAGFRCALAAFGRSNEPDFMRLVKASLSWGAINMLASIVLMIVSAGIAFGLERVGISLPGGTPALFMVPYAGAMAAAIYSVLILLYTCASAVPMTAVAYAATSKGRDPDPFFGFGAGLFALVAVMVIWVSGFLFLGVLRTLLEALATGTMVLMAQLTQAPLVDPIEVEWIPLAIAGIYTLWGTCWFCATAVLAWDRKIKRKMDVAEEIAQAPKHNVDDLRALRESRMPGLSGEP